MRGFAGAGRWQRPVLAGAGLLATLSCLAQALASLPEGAGRTQFIAACANCHEMSVVIAQGRTRDEWGTMISTMIDRGAQVADEDFDAIQDYLARFFPAKTPGQPAS